MENPTFVDVEILMGHQNPWNEDLWKIFGPMESLDKDKPIYEILLKKPQMWAIHSVKLDWGYLGIMSFTNIDKETGQVDTELVSIPHKKEQQPPELFLSLVQVKLEEQIAEHIQKTLDDMNKIMEGAIPTEPQNSTYIAIELIRQNYRDRNLSIN